MSDPLTEAATMLGAPYGMTSTDVLAYLATGERHHHDAPTQECGVVDPRDETRWCRRPVGHDTVEGHNRYRLDEDWASAVERGEQT